MIDFHTHSILSDGDLIASELVRRARVIGYSAIAITDHADESNMDTISRQIIKAARQLNRGGEIKVVPGVELTHIPPAHIPLMVKKARALGLGIVVGHGETLAEPVAPGTNMAYIRSGVDILAHPGLITEAECKLAVKNGIHLEITSRGGHSLSNGHVAAMAGKTGARMVLDTDSHSPGDLITDEKALNVALGAGIYMAEYRRMQNNAKELLRKVYG